MRLSLPGSLLVHASALVVMLVGLPWPEAQDAAAPVPVTVSIVPVTTVSTNLAEPIESDSTVSAVSAGTAATTIEPVTSETIEPVTAETLQPTPAPTQAEPAPQLMAELSSTAASPLSAAPVTPVAPEPVTVEEVSIAPVPQTLSVQRPSEPIVHKPQQPRPKPAATPPQSAGNGGKDDGDSQAAGGGAPQVVSNQGNGGDAEVARYPSQVLGKLRRALRRANGDAGEVIVRFTVLSDGQLSGVSVARSSGNGGVDEAGLALVRRAAPFPPIPAGAGRNQWDFDVPLAFGG